MANLVCLGKIVAAHGIKGEVKVKSFTANPKDIVHYGKLSDINQTRYFELSFKGFAKELLRIKINGVDTRNDAESIIGTELYIEREKLPSLKEDTFYQTDLIGMQAVDAKTLGVIGKVVGVYNFGAGDILEIKFEGIKQTEMLPFNDSYIPRVDIQNKTVFIAMRSMNFQKDEDDGNA